MEKKTKIDEINELLDKEFYVVANNHKYNYKRKVDFNKIDTLVKDIDDLIHLLYKEDHVKAGIRCRKEYIPLLHTLLDISQLPVEQKIDYYTKLEEAYRISARSNFTDFVRYYEWHEEDKFFEPRYPVLMAYAYYLNRMVFDPDFELLIVNLPSGTGKTYLEKLHEAFSFGVDPTGTCLYLCSNDDVVKGGSRTVMEIMRSERFGEVFPNMKYDKANREYFLKETEAEWKLRDCKLMASYYAKTTQSNVVGCRASKTIHIDDLYADYKEALDENLNVYFYNKYLTVWKKRYVQNKKPKIIVTGTMWSPTDFIVKVIDKAKQDAKFVKHNKFKYVLVNEIKDKQGKLILGKETQAIIQIPAMDYDTGETTCESLWTTEQLQKEKESMDTYLWETNFQQVPTSPEGLEFDWNNIQTYDEIPENDYGATYAVIDGTRKSGKDFFAMPIFQPYEQDYALVDCIFTKVASSELVPDIVDKMIINNIRILVIETNVDGGLKKLIQGEFEKRGLSCDCDIREKYNTVQKSIRIEMEKGIIKKRIWFPNRTIFGRTSQMGKFMDNLTLYNSQGSNKNDDAPDSVGMFTSEIIGEKSKPRRAKAVKRI